MDSDGRDAVVVVVRRPARPEGVDEGEGDLGLGIGDVLSLFCAALLAVKLGESVKGIGDC